MKLEHVSLLPGSDGWGTAISVLSSCDPHAVFSNPFLDQLLR